MTLTFILLLTGTMGFFSLNGAAGGVGVAQITTPSPTTSFSTTGTFSTTTTTTSTTSSTFSSVVTTSTSVTSTTTSMSSSYTSSRTLTFTNSSTSTSYTGTTTVGIITTTTTTITTSQTRSVTETATLTTTTVRFPGCLIATATFGSELAPEVQLLREFRDGSILKTSAGSSFMIAFNAWYYSFSPAVAEYLYDHWVERTIMKVILYPLIGFLKVSSLTYSVAGFQPELAALLSGLVASSLIGAFYVGVPFAIVRAKIRKLRGPGSQAQAQMLLLTALLGGIGLLLVGEILISPVILILSTVTVVLSTLFLAAVYTSDVIARKLERP